MDTQPNDAWPKLTLFLRQGDTLRQPGVRYKDLETGTPITFDGYEVRLRAFQSEHSNIALINASTETGDITVGSDSEYGLWKLALSATQHANLTITKPSEEWAFTAEKYLAGSGDQPAEVIAYGTIVVYKKQIPAE